MKLMLDYYYYNKVLIVLIIIVCCCCYGERANALTPAQCHQLRLVLVSACRPVMLRVPPSAACCERLRVTPVQCVCPVITPKIARLVDVNYAISVIQSCGRPVPRHFKCGSITTP